MAGVTVQALTVVDDVANSMVAVLPEEPLSLAVSSRPGYQERAVFVAPSLGPEWQIAFQRPGFTPEGAVLVAPDEDTADRSLYRAGLIDDVAVWVWASGQDSAVAESVVTTIVDSFGPA
jgi:hypothetical protein